MVTITTVQHTQNPDILNRHSKHKERQYIFKKKGISNNVVTRMIKTLNFIVSMIIAVVIVAIFTMTLQVKPVSVNSDISKELLL